MRAGLLRLFLGRTDTISPTHRTPRQPEAGDHLYRRAADRYLPNAGSDPALHYGDTGRRPPRKSEYGTQTDAPNKFDNADRRDPKMGSAHPNARTLPQSYGRWLARNVQRA